MHVHSPLVSFPLCVWLNPSEVVCCAISFPLMSKGVDIPCDHVGPCIGVWELVVRGQATDREVFHVSTEEIPKLHK